MDRFLAGVLSVIATGVLLIAYGLLVPGTSAVGSGNGGAAGAWATAEGFAPGAVGPVPQPVYVQGYTPAIYAYYPAAVPAAAMAPVSLGGPAVITPAPDVRPVQTVVRSEAPRRSAVVVDNRRGRSWKKTALLIGGSTAAGAGVGGIVAGKKGALIGAAIGGGASTIYESTK
jgi:hypothetical protein